MSVLLSSYTGTVLSNLEPAPLTYLQTLLADSSLARLYPLDLQTQGDESGSWAFELLSQTELVPSKTPGLGNPPIILGDDSEPPFFGLDGSALTLTEDTDVTWNLPEFTLIFHAVAANVDQKQVLVTAVDGSSVGGFGLELLTGGQPRNYFFATDSLKDLSFPVGRVEADVTFAYAMTVSASAGKIRFYVKTVNAAIDVVEADLTLDEYELIARMVIGGWYSGAAYLRGVLSKVCLFNAVKTEAQLDLLMLPTNITAANDIDAGTVVQSDEKLVDVLSSSIARAPRTLVISEQPASDSVLSVVGDEIKITAGTDLVSDEGKFTLNGAPAFLRYTVASDGGVVPPPSGDAHPFVPDVAEVFSAPGLGFSSFADFDARSSNRFAANRWASRIDWGGGTGETVIYSNKGEPQDDLKAWSQLFTGAGASKVVLRYETWRNDLPASDTKYYAIKDTFSIWGGNTTDPGGTSKYIVDPRAYQYPGGESGLIDGYHVYTGLFLNSSFGDRKNLQSYHANRFDHGAKWEPQKNPTRLWQKTYNNRGENFPPNTWVTVDFVLQTNTGSNKNGLTELWMNSVLVASSQGTYLTCPEGRSRGKGIRGLTFVFAYGGNAEDYIPQSNHVRKIRNMQIYAEYLPGAGINPGGWADPRPYTQW